MFSGIIEASVAVKNTELSDQLIRMTLEKPSFFNDLSVGDSIACNGVCLTVERFDEQEMVFALAAETLQITGWRADQLATMQWNVERSLAFGSRMHGHLVTGHVDQQARVSAANYEGDSLVVELEIAKKSPYLWRKGSVTINGVSLTLNEVELKDSGEQRFSVCLIPETLERTNLKSLQVGDSVNIEFDYMAKGIFQAVQNMSEGLAEFLGQGEENDNR